MVNVDYKGNDASSDDYLRYSQLIIDAFTKALDQNECTVKVLVGLHDQITEQKNTVTDLVDIADAKQVSASSGASSTTFIDKDIHSIVYTPNTTITPSNITAIKNRLKNRCIDCKLSFPKFDVSNNIKFSFDKLKVSLDAYLKAFNQLQNPNFCQASTVFNFACLQDLVKLIILFISVFSAILGLKKITSISLSGLIRGIISGLLGMLIGKLKLQMDASQTGIKCIIEAIKRLAMNIPDGESLNGYMEDEWFANAEQQEMLKNTTVSDDRSTITIPTYEDYTAPDGSIEKRITGYTKVPSGFTTSSSNSATTSTSDSKEEPFFNSTKLREAMSNLADDENQNYVKQFAKVLEKDSSDFEKIINNSFKYIDDTVNGVIQGFEEEINKVFGLLEYFQCELSRSGTDFTDILDFMNRIINVVNLLSAIVSVLAKKQIKKLCKSKSSTYDLSNEEKKLFRKEVNDLDPVEVIGEYLGKVVEGTSGGNDKIIPLIYNQPSEPMLPKLSMESCNLKEFIEAHSVDNIIAKAIETLRKEDEAEKSKDNTKVKYTSDKINNTSPYKYNTTGITAEKDYLSDKINKENESNNEGKNLNSTNNGRWTLYPIQYVTPKISDGTDMTQKVIDADSYKDLETNTDKSFGVNTILDFIYNNPETRIKDRTGDTSDDKVTNPIDNTELKSTEPLKTPNKNEYDPKSDVYLNKCRDINDVLSILERAKSK